MKNNWKSSFPNLSRMLPHGLSSTKTKVTYKRILSIQWLKPVADPEFWWSFPVTLQLNGRLWWPSHKFISIWAWVPWPDLFHPSPLPPTPLLPAIRCWVSWVNFLPLIAGSPDNGGEYSEVQREQHGSFGIENGDGMGGGTVLHIGGLDGDSDVNMSGTAMSSHILAKPVPVRRPSEKSIAQAKASIDKEFFTSDPV